MTVDASNDREDPVLRNARREGWAIIAAWAAATLYCCVYYASFGYNSPSHPLGKADVHPTFGMPSWFFWGVIVPWGACGVFTLGFVGFVMKEDDLGKDHSEDLDSLIRGRIDD
ncbi:MAG: hypothetical protein JWN86_4577 [Planctomycetota bacterium]|nr:hypothetical protein [Planctomycetota bacterium]